MHSLAFITRIYHDARSSECHVRSQFMKMLSVEHPEYSPYILCVLFVPTVIRFFPYCRHMS
jgi:hypothetical protein